MNRRTFLQRSSALAGAAAFFSAGPSSLLAALNVSVDEPILAAIRFASTYADRVLLSGECVIGILNGQHPAVTRFLAEVPDLNRFVDAVSAVGAHGITGAYTQGNLLTFSLGNRIFEVENLLAEDFVIRTSNDGPVPAFGHDAITYDPTSGKLRDPFRSRNRLRLIKRGRGGAQALQRLIDGLLVRHDYAVSEGEAFATFRLALLRGKVADPARAKELVVTLISNLSALAGTLSFSTVSRLVDSPLLHDALQLALGLDSRAIVTEYQNARQNLPSTYSDAAVWLAVILASQIQDGTVDAWFKFPSRAVELSSRSALAAAREIVSKYAVLSV